MSDRGWWGMWLTGGVIMLIAFGWRGALGYIGATLWWRTMTA